MKKTVLIILALSYHLGLGGLRVDNNKAIEILSEAKNRIKTEMFREYQYVSFIDEEAKVQRG